MLHEVDQSLKNMLLDEFKGVEGKLIGDESEILIGPRRRMASSPRSRY
jgi:hypothetical protein